MGTSSLWEDTCSQGSLGLGLFKDLWEVLRGAVSNVM